MQLEPAIRRPRLRAPARGARFASVLLGLVLAVSGLPGCARGPAPTPLERADAAYAAGRLDEARALYVESQRAHPETAARALLGLGRVTLALGDPDAAVEALGQLKRSDQRQFDTSARDDYARALFEAAEQRLGTDDDIEGALRLLRKLRLFDKAYPGGAAALATAHTRMGEQLSRQGQRTRALVHFAQARALKPGSADAWVGAAEILIAATRQSEALRLLGEARDRFPSDGRVRSLAVRAMRVE